MSLHRSFSAGPFSGTSPWLQHTVFGLDRWLRRRQNVYEFTQNDNCLFRVQQGTAEENLTLSDGTRIAIGDPILILHLWNEHIPAIPENGPTIAWARQISNALDSSLQDLARYLVAEPTLDEVVAIRAEMRLGAGDQLIRIAARFGFEPANTNNDPESALHRVGENILIFLLVLASNPAAIRMPVLWRGHKLVYLSRAELLRRYTAGANPRVRT